MQQTEINPQIIMKTKILSLTMTVWAVTALVGCGHQPENNTPTATNVVAEPPPMPVPAAMNNAAAQPAVTPIITPNPVPTNSGGTTNPAVTNQ